MVGFFRPGLFLAAAGAVAVGVWIMLTGTGDGMGFPFELPDWMLVAGKDVAIGAIAIFVGLILVLVALVTKPTVEEEEANPPSVSRVHPED